MDASTSPSSHVFTTLKEMYIHASPVRPARPSTQQRPWQPGISRQHCILQLLPLTSVSNSFNL